MGYGLGLDFIDDGRAFAPIDFDQDGDLDLVRVSLTRLQLLKNVLARNNRNFARVELRATKTHAYALGAEVILEADGITQRDYVKLTAGFQTQVSRELHFGLGEVAQIEKLTVRWPSGKEQVFSQLPVNRHLLITESLSEPKISELISWPQSKIKNNISRASLEHEVRDLDGKTSKLIRHNRQPTLINFWAPWCKPCKKELPILAKLSERKGLRFVGISVETENLESVRATLKQFNIEYEQYLANDSLLASFFGTDSEAQLPSTFIFNDEGQLTRAFFHAVGQTELEAAIDQLKPLPFNAQLMLPLGEEHLVKGDLPTAIRHLKRGLESSPTDAPLLAHLGWAYSQQNKHEQAISTLRRATKLDPNFPYSWYALAVAYKRQGTPQKAIPVLEKALHFQPKVAKYWMTLGAVYSQSGDLERGQASFEQVVELEPHSVDGWLNLGKTKILRKQGTGAEEFRRVLKLNPRHRAARALLDRYGGSSE